VPNGERAREFIDQVKEASHGRAALAQPLLQHSLRRRIIMGRLLLTHIGRAIGSEIAEKQLKRDGISPNPLEYFLKRYAF